MELSVPVEGGHLWADNTRGNGPALVLLHPGWGDSSIWLPVLERLPPHYRVVRYDSGGAGTAIGLALAAPARVRGMLLPPGVPDYPWPPDDTDFRQFDQLYSTGDRDGLAELGLRTWAAAGADQAAQAQVRGAADAFFRLGDYERPDPPAYSGLAQIQVPAVVIVGDQEYPMVARCAPDIAARLTGCQQIAGPGADHLLPLRAPTMIAELAGDLAR